MALQKGDLILFQGDSITDCGRSKESTESLGNGYARLAVNAISVLRPETELRFLNRAISGNRTIDVLERWEEDCIALRPAFLSVLLGINDVWHHDVGRGLTVAETEENYTKILTRTREALGDIPIVILSPFLLPDHTTKMKRPDVDAVIAVSKRLAEKFGASYVPLDTLLSKAAEAFPPLSLTKEGVHPTEQGHGIIAKHWLDAALPLI